MTGFLPPSVARFVAACLLLLLACWQPCRAAPLRVMPLGDSNTAGATEGAYRTRLWQNFGSDPNRVTFLGSQQSGPPELGDKRHQGHSGFTIAESSSGFGSLTAVANGSFSRGVFPDFILLMIGTNDMNQNYQVATAPARLDHLISVISDRATGQRPDAKLIVASVPPIDDARNQFRSALNDTANLRVNAFNAAIPGIVAAHRARGENVFFCDINSALTLADIADGLHPTVAGYAKVADAWYAAIQALPEPSSAALAVALAPLVVRRRRRFELSP